jgi:hypothetical protein
MKKSWKWLDDFDPATAEPHLCWAVLELETQGYIRIERGKIHVTPKGRSVSPRPILKRKAKRIDRETAREILRMESQGCLTVRNGMVSLTAAASKLSLLVYGAKAELIAKGIIEGESQVSPEELKEYQELKASGYAPTKREVRRFLMAVEQLEKDQAKFFANLLLAEFARQIPDC